MKKFLLNLILFLSFPVFAQVGIGTDSPKAQLDIISYNPSNPEVIDGILIPRLKKFPATTPGTDQHGMLVFLNADIPGYDSGFYYWDSHNKKWTQVGGSAAGDFYKPGTTTSPGNIQEPVYRQGNVGIGTEEITSKLQITLNSPADAAIKKGLEVDNNNATVDNLTTYGIINNNRSATNGTKYGLKNNVGGLGSGVHYGIFTETYQNAGTNDIYGIFNRVGRTFGAKSDNFGIYSQIGTNQGQGNIYGIYSVAQGDHNARVYAGYFVGRVGIGLSPQQEYILPAARGVNEQFLTLDSSGNLNWTYNNIRNYSSTTSVTGAYQIPDDVYSLRINDAVSAIAIPPANLHKGRLITLIAWKGTKTKPFVFSNNDDIYDVVNDASIASITGSQIMTIQSAGNRWVLLNIRKAP
jgi:hypothetical protein